MHCRWWSPRSIALRALTIMRRCAPLEAVCREAGIKGTLLLAPEGINGTIAGTREGVDRVLAHIRALSGCAALDVKESGAAEMPFFRMKVRLKREIVTMEIGRAHV